VVVQELMPLELRAQVASVAVEMAERQAETNPGNNGTVNLGGGGGGGSRLGGGGTNTAGGNGGSGVVIVKYPAAFTISNPGGGLTLSTIEI
jgi:hypothetical protein